MFAWISLSQVKEDLRNIPVGLHVMQSKTKLPATKIWRSGIKNEFAAILPL